MSTQDTPVTSEWNWHDSQILFDPLAPRRIIDQICVFDLTGNRAPSGPHDASDEMFRDTARFIHFVEPKDPTSGQWRFHADMLYRGVEFHFSTWAGYNACAIKQPGRWPDNGKATEQFFRDISPVYTADGVGRCENYIYFGEDLQDCHKDCLHSHACACPLCEEAKQYMNLVVGADVADPHKPRPALSVIAHPHADTFTLRDVYHGDIVRNIKI